jgi:hypothetical protein
MADLRIVPDAVTPFPLVEAIDANLRALQTLLESQAGHNLSVEQLRDIGDHIADWAMQISTAHHTVIDRRTVRVARSL